jgi:hypothetical protein
MKKTFIVEVDYEELPENVERNADVLYDLGLEVTLEDMMYSYKQTGSIKGDYEVNVKQIFI